MYLLVNGFRDVVYVGSSEHVRARLKSHWSDKRNLIDSWEVIPCASSAEMRSLEADLIFQHQPRLNKALRDKRRR